MGNYTKDKIMSNEHIYQNIFYSVVMKIFWEVKTRF